MANNYARPLNTDYNIVSFLTNCLSISTTFKMRSGQFYDRAAIARKLRDAEASVSTVQGKSTVSSTDCRSEVYSTEAARQELRRQIINELITLPRLENDDEIKLGKGGALPLSRKLQTQRKAYIVTGLPASGKSTLVNKIADELGSMIVDSDYAKRKFPEFDSLAGAQLVHDESSLIVEGGNIGASGEEEPSLIGFCKTNGINIVMPKIGHDISSLAKLQEALIKSGYTVHITTVLLPRAKAAYRALDRFLHTGRYVPLGLVFDSYANDPALSYFKLRVTDLNKKSNWASFGALCSDSGGYEVVDCSSDENPAAIFRSYS